ncbi:hypothetical protein M433DRAFT_156219 [Acidomyces richmondensis BFW]|nr:MAG: hypothetical protein FE78DRAFT_93006 [Acidomyces sp. 'richmondensis']KYG43877.1 hypothetical protein M433DRAFT_156219 [Acidomyces richmondensis BFW]
MNCRLIRPRLSLFLVSHRMHEEAYPVFYAQPVRLFPSPNHGRFFHTKRPLLARLPPHYRRVINTIELRLGPGWSAPPQCQQTIENPALGLADCTHLRMLKIFVELDPSDSIFTGFRGKNATEETYKYFCLDLLQGILESVPSLETVEIDAYSGVKRDAPLVLALERMVRQDGRGRLTLVWGPLRGWENAAGQSSEMGQDRALAGLAMRGGTHAMATYIEVQA